MSEAAALPATATALAAADEQQLATITPRELTWRRFKRHRLALASGCFLGVLYLIAAVCEFISPYKPETRNVAAINAPPMLVRFFDVEGNFHLRPFVYGYDMEVNADTWMREYTINPDKHYPLRFFSAGDSYQFWNLFRAETHLFTAEGGYIHVFGTDQLGRDMFSRVFYGARVSLSIGLVGLVMTFVLGIVLGGLAGYIGRWVDRAIQRLTAVLLSIPQLPLWMALTAALPPRLVAAAGLLRRHHHPLAVRLDDSGASGAGPIPRLAGGGVRGCGAAHWGTQNARDPASHAAELP